MNKVCSVCGKIFRTTPSRNQITCSHRCAGIRSSQTNFAQKGITVLSDGRARVSIAYQNASWYLGTYSSKEEAVKVYQNAVEQKTAGRFETWYTEISAGFKPLRKHKLPPRKGKIVCSQDGMCSLQMSLGGKRYWLGVHPSREQAEALAREANLHFGNGDFDEWYLRWRANYDALPNIRGRQNRREGSGVYLVKNRFRVIPRIDKKLVYIGTFGDEETARKVLETVNTHIDAGDFAEWLEAWKQDRKTSRKKKK